ncbi:MAG: FKBP-type peptidyl-prolyl cis-trans isomerase [Bacteroidota bacterium]
MKINHLFLASASVLIAITSVAQNKPVVKKAVVAAKPAALPVPVKPLELKTQKDSVSYALGVEIAKNLIGQNLGDVEFKLLTQGLEDMLKKKPVSITEEDANKCIQDYMQKAKSAKAGGNKEAGKKFMAENAKKKGIVSLPNGIQYEVLKTSADTIKPKLTDKVKCHYHGTLIDGTIFDSSVDRGEPVTFPLNGVIKGWQEALQLMTVGSKWRIFIPSDLAYGDNSAGEKIGPGSTLIFEVELIAIEK